MSYNALYRGVCTRNNDPAGRLRIRAKVPSLLGTEETNWALPCLPPGWRDGLATDHSDPDGDHGHTLVQRVPAVGERVWVMFENGDLTYPVWLGVW